MSSFSHKEDTSVHFKSRQARDSAVFVFQQFTRKLEGRFEHGFEADGLQKKITQPAVFGLKPCLELRAEDNSGAIKKTGKLDSVVW